MDYGQDYITDSYNSQDDYTICPRCGYRHRCYCPRCGYSPGRRSPGYGPGYGPGFGPGYGPGFRRPRPGYGPGYSPRRPDWY